MIYRLGKKRKLHSEINVVPYIDVMLVLLIIFMVLSPLLIQGIEVNLPKTDTTKMSIQSEPLVISINSKGEYFLNLGDESLSISIAELKDKASIIYQANEDIEVVFKGDKDVKFESIARAMATVQSVGITKIGIVTSGYVQE
jgi:biopolymer transport protein TolR